jgi:hypothetical protein
MARYRYFYGVRLSGPGVERGTWLFSVFTQIPGKQKEFQGVFAPPLISEHKDELLGNFFIAQWGTWDLSKNGKQLFPNGFVSRP